MVLSLKKPARRVDDAKVDRLASVLAGAEKRIVAEVPERIHRALRLRCAERGTSVRDYVLELLSKDGIV